MKNLRFQFANPDALGRPYTLHPTSCIKVIGVGGAGGNVINTISSSISHPSSFSTIAINTDMQALSISRAHYKLQIGKTITQGLGAGGRPEIGKSAMYENIDDFKELIKPGTGTQALFIIAGMGGGTGTGASPVIASIAKQMGIFTIAIVTSPFDFEGEKRELQAIQGINELKKNTDALIIIPNQKLFSITKDSTSLLSAFELVNKIIFQTIQGITDIICEPGLVNVDFADVRELMALEGETLVSTGVFKTDNQEPIEQSPDFSGQNARQPITNNRALIAMQQAVNSPLLAGGQKLRLAKGALVNIVGPRDITLQEANAAISYLKDRLHFDANIIFGVQINKEIQNEVRITIILTGINQPTYFIQPQGPHGEENLRIPTFKRKLSIECIQMNRDAIPENKSRKRTQLSLIRAERKILPPHSTPVRDKSLNETKLQPRDGRKH